LDEARHFDALARNAGRRLRVHVAVDTGMGRGGFLPEELADIVPQLQNLAGLEIEGLGSHLPAADEDRAFSEKQFQDFDALIAALGGASTFHWRHLANSAGLLGYPAHHCNLVRPGLLLYGVSPLNQSDVAVQPVMTLKSRISLIRTLPAGHGVSYGRAFVTSRPTRVATVGIGYGDGYPRHVSGHQAQVAIGGQRFPVLGRVTMDQLMIDVTDAPEVTEGAEVELFGREISVREVAQWADTIAWHIFTGITPRVARIYRD
jgi:alanine racemase